MMEPKPRHTRRADDDARLARATAFLLEGQDLSMRYALTVANQEDPDTELVAAMQRHREMIPDVLASVKSVNAGHALKADKP